MFRVEFIERYISRVRPWQVVALWLPVLFYLIAGALRDPGLNHSAALVLIGGGLAGWTLLEYLLHRFLFHFSYPRNSELACALWFLLHEVHHEYPHDRDRLVMPPIVSITLAIMIGLPLRALAGPHAFGPLFGGIIAGYLWYDLTHYAAHHWKPLTGWGRRRKSHHLRHHFKEPGSRFGVTTPLWDYVFGTMAASPAEVERKRESRAS